MAQHEYRAVVHEEDGSYWAEVEGLPGCFASGADLDELRDAIADAIGLYLEEGNSSGRHAKVVARVDEMRVLVS